MPLCGGSPGKLVGHSRLDAAHWTAVSVDSNTHMKVPSGLDFYQKLESNGVGTTAIFRNRNTSARYAVRKIAGVAEDLSLPGRLQLQELLLLRQLRHDSIPSILDLFPPESPYVREMYSVSKAMDVDLLQVIGSRQRLMEEHCQYYLYAILRGLKFLHSANVVHCNIRPSTILLNMDDDVIISDFTRAQGFGKVHWDEKEQSASCSWYDAPERTLFGRHATGSWDVWAAGCVLCELMGRRAIFPGEGGLDQVQRILEVVGSPSQEELEWLPPKSPARRDLTALPVQERRTWSAIYPTHSGAAHEALGAMLRFHPERRLSAATVLELPFFGELHDPEDEPLAEEWVDWSQVSAEISGHALRDRCYELCWEFRPELAVRDRALLLERGVRLRPLRATANCRLHWAAP